MTRLYLHHCPHAAGGGGGVSTRVTAQGAGDNWRGDIRCRGEPAAAQIDFYHDTYYCQLTAGDRGAVSGCGVRRGWAAYRLLPQIDPSVKLYNHREGPY